MQPEKGPTMNAQDYDFSGKMKENRQQWRDAGISTSSYTVPDKYRDYFKAMSNMMCAERLLELIEEHDEQTMYAFANRQPRMPVSHDELLDIRTEVASVESGTHKNTLLEKYDDLFRLMTDKREAGADAKLAVAEGDEVRAVYYMAREYAVAYYLRGAVTMLKLHIAGRVPDLRKY